MIRTTLADTPEQFTTGNDEKHVGRRVQLKIGDYVYDVSRTWYLPDGRKGTTTFDSVLFQLDCDAGLIFVDPSILRPYQRPERKEND